MKIYDISMEISGKMPVYKNKAEKKPLLKRTRTMKQGSNESKISLDMHTGTHADAYYHMLSKGKKINQISLDKFIGNCVVLDLTKIKDKITVKDLKNKTIKKSDIVLLKTLKKPIKKFNKNFTYLEKTGASFLSSKKIRSVGIDALGIERAQPKHETHKILFKKNILIIEGLDLSKIKPGRYFFIGMPLKIKDGDASPIRAVLVRF
jgi:arylformamidase